jgi:hypothetical protein
MILETLLRWDAHKSPGSWCEPAKAGCAPATADSRPARSRLRPRDSPLAARLLSVVRGRAEIVGAAGGQA